MQSCDSLQTARDGMPFVRTFDEVRAIFVDHTVTIEDDELHVASLEMSAT